VHRDRQTLLLGRIHLDPENSMSFKDFGFLGTYELARVTGLPLQNAARRSPGGGFTAMQIRAALDREILLPLNKKRHEKFKSALELVEADNGGLVYQPLIGLHEKVAGIDFFSMFPSIMSAWNISPETVNTYGEHTRFVPGINRPISQDHRGVVPTVLEPILVKRRQSKTELKRLKKDDEQYGPMKTMTETLKWLGWVSFGYQGFSGNRIGSIEAHESINGVSRDLLLHAKEAAEEQGFMVIHMYVDSLFIKKAGCETETDFDAVIEEMNQRTGLMLELEGIFNWIIFLPSKTDEDLPIPNCFFGAYQNGETKCRGIMARRGDTPIFVVESQMRAIRLMARAEDAAALRKLLPKLVYFLRQKYQQLTNEKIAMRELVISQRLGRELEDYKALSSVGRAAQQLALAGKQPRAGQRVDYLRVIAEGDVLAWALSSSQQQILLDFAWYQQAFLRAAHELVQCFGITKETLELWLQDQESYFRPEDYVNGSNQELPLLILNSPPGTPPVAD
jgi:DNA polymerase-2